MSDVEVDQVAAEPVPLNAIRKPEPTIPTAVKKAAAEVDSDKVKAAFQKIIEVIDDVGKEFLDGESKAAHDMRNWYDYAIKELRWRISRGHD